MKKIKNILLILIILTIATISTNCYAKVESKIDIESSIQISANHGGGGKSRATSDLSKATVINPDNYKPSSPTSTDLGTAGKSKVENMLGWITIIGIIVSIASISILGIKYMVGSIEERAEYKKTMLPILIGMILLFGTSTILNIINTVMNS